MNRAPYLPLFSYTLQKFSLQEYYYFAPEYRDSLKYFPCRSHLSDTPLSSPRSDVINAPHVMTILMLPTWWRH